MAHDLGGSYELASHVVIVAYLGAAALIRVTPDPQKPDVREGVAAAHV